MAHLQALWDPCIPISRQLASSSMIQRRSSDLDLHVDETSFLPRSPHQCQKINFGSHTVPRFHRGLHQLSHSTSLPTKGRFQTLQELVTRIISRPSVQARTCLFPGSLHVCHHLRSPPPLLTTGVAPESLLTHTACHGPYADSPSQALFLTGRDRPNTCLCRNPLSPILPRQHSHHKTLQWIPPSAGLFSTQPFHPHPRTTC